MTEIAEIRGPARATRMAGPVDREPASAPPSDVAPAPEASPEIPSEQEREQRAEPPQQVERPARSGGFLPLFLGGVAAALTGFAVANYAVPEGWPRPAETDPELPARLSSLEAGLETVSGRVEDLAETVETVAANSPTTEDVSGIRGEIETVRGELSSLEESVAEITPGTEPAPELPDFTGAFNEQMSAFEAEIDRVTSAAEAEVAAARAEAEATREAAELAERQAKLRAALSDIEIALDTGAPFASELSDIEGLDVPDALASVADDGVTPLSELQRRFPDAARSALGAAGRGPEEGADPVDRFAAFLRAQTNARSLEPRAGDDTDAVLSRAEAALRSGDLEAALSEIESLEEGPKEAMDEWLAAAGTRLQAEAALASLGQDIEDM